MYLYEKVSGNKVAVHSLIPNLRLINKYKEKKLEQIGFQLYQSRISGRTKNIVNYDGNELVDLDEVRSPQLKATAYSSYLQTNVGNSMVVKQDDKYLLLLHPFYHRQANEELVMSGIISLSKSLYLFELLNRGCFTLIQDEDISEQLGLYVKKTRAIVPLSNSDFLREQYSLDDQSLITVTEKILKKFPKKSNK